MLVAATLTLVLAAAAAAAPAAPSTSSAQADTTFARALYGKLAAEEGNVFFSPYSVETALGMTYAGARGNTAAEMVRTLNLPMSARSPESALAERAALARDLNAEKGADGQPRAYQLSVANALWGQKGKAFLPDFTKLVKDNYGAGLEELDFIKDTEGSRKTINAWVEKQTREKIKDLLQPGILTTDTRLVLTNAIYFKGTWSKAFEKVGTRDEPFKLAGGKEVKAPMMNQEGKYGYLEAANCQIVKLPYKGDELSMVVILPKAADGLARLEKDMTPALLHSFDGGKFQREEVILALPKFKIVCQYSLAEPLAALGMKDAFTAAADFSGMDGEKDLFISAVVHKAFVEVNEEGTEAAAATAAVATAMAMPMQPKPPVIFKADHPFLFLIRHEKSGAILFMGRVADPTK
jgi:serpin B